MKKFAFIAALYFCIACGLRAETAEAIIEQAAKKLEAYERIADTPFRLAFSVFLDEGQVNEDIQNNIVKNFDNELSGQRPPDLRCSLRFLAPDKFRLDIIGNRSMQMSFVVDGDKISTTERHSAKEIDSSVAASLKRIVDFIGVRGPKQILANFRNSTLSDRGDTTVDGIKCRRIDFRQSNSGAVSIFVDNKSKELIAANLLCQLSKENVMITYKYTSIPRNDQASAFIGSPEYVFIESADDTMRFDQVSFTKMENADESILQISE